MEIFIAIVASILLSAILASLFWILVGIPVGIIFLALRASKKLTISKKISKKSILLIMCGGFALLIVSLILFFIFNFFAGLLGFHLTHTILPSI